MTCLDSLGPWTHVAWVVGWILGGVIFIALGLAIWWTAFVLVPLGVIFIILGIVTAVKARKAAAKV